VLHSTVTANEAAVGAGIERLTGTATVLGSILANTGNNCAGTVTSGGYNVVDDATCAFTAAGDQQNTAPLLGALADNGGATPTQLPQVGSPVLDAILAGIAGLCDGSITVDQRGLPRPAGTHCDIGAVERQPTD
jgi:hypothetical protein